MHSPGFSRVGIASGIHQLGIQLCPNQGKVGEQNTDKVGMGANSYFKRHRLRQYNQAVLRRK